MKQHNTKATMFVAYYLSVDHCNVAHGEALAVAAIGAGVGLLMDLARWSW